MVEEVRLVHCILLTTEAGDSCGEAVLVSMSRVEPMGDGSSGGAGRGAGHGGGGGRDLGQ